MATTQLSCTPKPMHQVIPRVYLKGVAALTISMTVGINTDVRRLSLMLTIPEYLEAWICVPGSEEGSPLEATELADGFRLNYSANGNSRTSITGLFLFRHRHKMRMVWRTSDDGGCRASMVDFRLRGNFGSSTLELHHAALASAGEYAWHHALWSRSLVRLALLFQAR